MFRKEHKNVLRSLEKLLPALKADDFDRLNFEPITCVTPYRSGFSPRADRP